MSWGAVVEWTSRRKEQQQTQQTHCQDRDKKSDNKFKFVLYNGTNADDVKDVTRVGLKAAREFDVCSPLLENGLGKEDVRAVGRAWGLPNWNAAASPCLRSRLALGVRATPASLRKVELAEEIVKKQPSMYGLLRASTNLRVRHLKSGAAAVELDQHVLDTIQHGHIVVKDGHAVIRNEGDKGHHNEQNESSWKVLRTCSPRLPRWDTKEWTCDLSGAARSPRQGAPQRSKCDVPSPSQRKEWKGRVEWKGEKWR